MIINDPLYGEVAITDKLAQDLISTPTFQRLKDITQSGIPDKWNVIQSYSRYEHSIGVYHLLVKYGANRREQIIGLLHDISHRAFSHLYEWLVDKTQSVHENLAEKDLEQFLIKQDIVDQFLKHNFNPIRPEELETSMLLDQSVPDLCLDRLDYSVREYSKYVGKSSLNEQLEDMVLWDAQIEKFYFDSSNLALEYARAFLELQENVWDSLHSTWCYNTISDLFLYAINKDYLSLQLFDIGEKEVLNAVEAHRRDPKIARYLSELNGEASKTVLGKTQVKKFRYVDPLIKADEKRYMRTSEVFPKFKEQLEKARDKNSKGQTI